MNQNAQHPLYLHSKVSPTKGCLLDRPLARSFIISQAAGAGKCQWIYYHCGFKRVRRGAKTQKERKRALVVSCQKVVSAPKVTLYSKIMDCYWDLPWDLPGE